MAELRPFCGLIGGTKLVTALDVSSHQQNNLQSLLDLLNPDHVIVRMYLPIEQPSQQISRDQVARVLDNGKTVGTYFWLYNTADPKDSAKQAIELALSCGIEIPIMLVDFETYKGTIPTVDQVIASLLATEAEGQRAGVYTGKWVMDAYAPGDTRLSAWPLWDGALRLPKTIHLDQPYSGWTECIGRQFSSQPCDQSIFREAFTLPSVS